MKIKWNAYTNRHICVIIPLFYLISLLLSVCWLLTGSCWIQSDDCQAILVLSEFSQCVYRSDQWFLSFYMQYLENIFLCLGHTITQLTLLNSSLLILNLLFLSGFPQNCLHVLDVSLAVYSSSMWVVWSCYVLHLGTHCFFDTTKMDHKTYVV